MGISRSLILRAGRSKWLAEHFMRRPFARRAVQRFLPGEELGDALAASRRLAPQHIGVLVTRLGETLTGESQALQVRNHYLGAYDTIRAEGLPAVISVKPSQLGVDQSYDECLAHLQLLAAKADETGSQLWIDMEGSAYVDRTLDLFLAVRAQHEPVGVAVQAYLRRTPADVERLLGSAGCPMIRLVKGAYAEPSEIAFPDKADVDRQFIALGEHLLKAASQGKAHPVFGTHDMTIVRQMITRAGTLGLPKEKYEVQMLYGIQTEALSRLAAEGHLTRCFINYGTQWFPWYMRRLAERPANVWFVVRSIFMR